MDNFENLRTFVSFTHKFQQVKRKVLVTGESRYENDSEHSYQLALVAWYLVATHKLPLDLEKTLLYALAHDLVEAHAGDVPAYDQTREVIEQKKEDEHAALQKIKKDFPHFFELSNVIEDYEKQTDDESRFVYALDKLLPMINVYLDDGKSWKEEGASLDFLLKIKVKKIDRSEIISKYFEELKKLLEADKDKLFPPNPIY